MNTRLLLAISLFLLLALNQAGAAQSAWVYYNNAHTLVYSNDNLGNHLPDFSYAGYEGGGVAIPTNVPVMDTLSPVAGDNTAAIQAAINYVSGLPLGTNGFRGAVLLNPGTYQIAGTLTISASGVILRGSGNNTNTGTSLLVTGDARNVLTISGSGSWSKTGGSYNISDSYVPLGATSFHLSSTPGFSVGSLIVIQRPWTQAWIDAIGMSNYWTPATGLQFERTVTAINGNQIAIDVPLDNPIESQWTGGLVYQAADSARIQQVGVENLCAVGQIADYPSNILTGVFAEFGNLKNGWMRNLLLSGWGNGLTLGGGTKWCTVQDCQYVAPGTGTSDAAPAAWTISGAQELFQRCTSDGPYYHIMVTQDSTPGPNVFLNLTCSGTHYNGGPHQRWAAGALHDCITMAADPDPAYTPYLAINNRGSDGSGQGWAAGFSVMYNCQVPQFQLEQPGVTNHYNWTIGGTGSEYGYSDNGIYDAVGTMLNPNSLCLEQLRERLGGAAVENIGYQLFTIASPPVFSVLAGSNATLAVTLGDPALMGNIVTLTNSGLPAGASVSWSTNAVTGAGSALLTLTASNTLAPGSYAFNLIGANAGLTHTSSVVLYVDNFSLAASPASRSVPASGGPAIYTLTLATNSSFSGSVNLGLSGLPAGTSASFNPATLAAGSSATLTVTVSSNTLAGDYALNLTGTNGGSVAAATVSLAVGGNLTWNGGGASADWSDPGNWNGLAVAANAPLFFDGPNRLNNTNDTTAGTTYSNLVFNATAGAFVLGGNPIILAGNITNNSASPQTVTLGLNFNRNLVFNGAGGGLIIGGGLTNTLGTSGATTITLSGTGVLTNLFHSIASPGGTNVLSLNDASANWTLLDNPSSASITVPWTFSINQGVFTYGSAGSAPVLASTTGNGAPQDNEVGSISGTNGILNLIAGTLTTDARLDTATALNSTGIVNQTGGTFNLGNQFQGANGANAGELSLVTLSGGTMNIGSAGNPTSPFYVASRGMGMLTLSNAAVLNCGTLDVSRNANGNSLGSVGTVNLNGGTLLCNKVGTATANSQTNWLNGSLATFNFNGGTLEINSGTPPFFQGSTAAPIIPIAAIVRSGGAVINSNAKTNVFAEPLWHDSTLGSAPDGGLTKNGAGSLILVSNLTYTGGTTINAGSLVLSNTAALNSSPLLTVAAGATLDVSGQASSQLALVSGQTLQGAGLVNGNLLANSGATVAPGPEPGILTVNGNAALAGVTFVPLNQAAGTNAGLQVSGALTYGGTLSLTNLAGALTNGVKFKLFNAASYAGAFTNLTPAMPGSGLAWNTSSLITNGTLRVVTASPPKITKQTATKTNLILTGTNGIPDGAYYLLFTTNLSQPPAAWRIVQTNQFDGQGNFNFTNPVNQTGPPSFYLLRLP